MGGVDSGVGAYEKFINGASLVQLYTSMVFKGPDIASTISNELVDILNHKGAKDISEIIGTKNWSWLITLECLYSYNFYVKKMWTYWENTS